MNKENNLDKFIEQNFTIRCSRLKQKLLTNKNNEVINVIIYKRPNSDMISSQVDCPCNFGPHGEYCDLKQRSFCIYSFDME